MPEYEKDTGMVRFHLDSDMLPVNDLRNYNYYFTEKEYERVKLEADEQHAQELEKKIQETEIQTKIRVAVNNVIMFHCSIKIAMEAAELDSIYHDEVVTELKKRNVFFTEQ